LGAHSPHRIRRSGASRPLREVPEEPVRARVRSAALLGRLRTARRPAQGRRRRSLARGNGTRRRAGPEPENLRRHAEPWKRAVRSGVPSPAQVPTRLTGSVLAAKPSVPSNAEPVPSLQPDRRPRPLYRAKERRAVSKRPCGSCRGRQPSHPGRCRPGRHREPGAYSKLPRRDGSRPEGPA
jgi:hypothetical protein